MNALASLPLAAGGDLTLPTRKALLIHLHDYADNMPAVAVHTLLQAWGHPGLSGERREYLWESYRQERWLQARLREPGADWRDAEPGLTSGDRRETARLMVTEQALGYLHELTTGEKKR